MTNTPRYAFRPSVDALDDRCPPSAALSARLHLPVRVSHPPAAGVEYRLAVHHHPSVLHHPRPHSMHRPTVNHPRIFVPAGPVVEPFLPGPDIVPPGAFPPLGFGAVSPLDFGVGPAVDFSGIDPGFVDGGCGCGDFGGGADFGGDGGGF